MFLCKNPFKCSALRQSRSSQINEYIQYVIILCFAAWWRVTLLSLTPWKCVTTQNGIFAVVIPISIGSPSWSASAVSTPASWTTWRFALYFPILYPCVWPSWQRCWFLRNGHSSTARSFHYQQLLEANSLFALGSPSWSPSAVSTSALWTTRNP